MDENTTPDAPQASEPVESAPDQSQADSTPEESAPAEAPEVNVEQADNVTVHPSGGDQVSDDTPGVDDTDESEEPTS